MQNLTNKEIEILNLLTNGYSNKEKSARTRSKHILIVF